MTNIKSSTTTEPLKKTVFRNVMISMPENFVHELDQYLANHPIEGSRSSFVVRIVANYIKTNNDKTKT
ncbi:hypothetical protein EDM53_03935 [Rickettsiales endosymbiont of Peranema trichophorum]|uniref:hypothetical protein n=1 Tax=Rickettsiales endosymbiont of Peranema trichophorum TaxID=2486577 RepID=UPI001022B114|nr:hypothetical protein [Rickettsiales endosymbiont of Peranema trichophorum]RZI46702.1 hypothetical protein EDM53_03935 [Rickettsiales endosymbiont of Peranema trichophorum]